MRLHLLEREQVLGRPLPEVFDFFAEARNLERITLGRVGELVGLRFVRRDLERIFDYRQATVAGLLQ